eukprot:CAMPEP_0174378950 /NCGR_PEP_ID=MMETSP0811_2-20130205/122383_1 /TAXON_ID=73025 ORGANISM="Eutreptiella gymnastica-like, Strain CCMP1594" /NCGR_SAMPLE_ID=MMETSP0811_2 /ASSEMBLY_ACC=CAM_ASM_000667 /LENGTH=111 /DNA_ID=CAMNT_0015531323 /DNA_START=97 /DNA_END=430 /DNA_ORIENTATION=+
MTHAKAAVPLHEFAAHEFGKVLRLDGHADLIPVTLGVGGHKALRPNDLVPNPGVQVRAKAVAGVSDLWKHVRVPVSPPDTLLPQSCFPKSGNLFRDMAVQFPCAVSVCELW